MPTTGKLETRGPPPAVVVAVGSWLDVINSMSIPVELGCRMKSSSGFLVA